MKGLLLVSGGIDSPVAGYRMLQRGMELDAIHFRNNGGLDTVKKLLKKIGIKRLILVDHVPNQEEILKVKRKYHCIVCKRVMYRIAAGLGYDCLVTGENLAQVASQTMANLVILDEAVDIPVFRPLIGFEKQEIIDEAKEIGTFKTSISYNKACPYVPKHPLTAAQLEKVKQEEKKIEIKSKYKVLEL